MLPVDWEGAGHLLGKACELPPCDCKEGHDSSMRPQARLTVQADSLPAVVHYHVPIQACIVHIFA